MSQNGNSDKELSEMELDFEDEMASLEANLNGLDTETGKLKIQAAKSSELVFKRYLEQMQKQLSKTFEPVSGIVADLSAKFAELSERVDSLSQVRSVLAPPMEVDGASTAVESGRGASAQPDLGGLPSTDFHGGPERSLGIPVRRDDTYRARRVDAIRLHAVDPKLVDEDGFKHWLSSVTGEIESQDCSFVIDPNEPTPPEFPPGDIVTARRKVRHFLMQSMSTYFRDLVNDLSDPKLVLDRLKSACEPSSAYQQKRLVKEFNEIHFDPNSERAVEFLTRFEDIRKKLVGINPNLVSPDYTKLIFESAIKETVTYKRAELNEFKYTISQLRDMLLDERLRSDEDLSGGSSYALTRSGIAGSRGRGGTARGIVGRGRKGGHIPGQARNFTPRQVSDRSKPSKNAYCSFCRRRGHDVSSCRKKLGLCYNCGKTNKHVAAQCPDPPTSKTVSCNESRTSAQNRLTKPVSFLNRVNPERKDSKPKTFRMPMGAAKKLAEIFRRHPDSVFGIAGHASDDSQEVWVTMGPNEEQEVSTINYASECLGTGTTFQLSEGKTKNVFSAIVDTGCTEHLTSSRDVLSNFRKLPSPRIFRCANSSEGANLTVNYCGDIEFMNNGQRSKLQNVLYTPSLSSNLFSIRKITQTGINVLFSKHKVEFVQKPSGRVIKTGKFCDNLWHVEFDVISNQMRASSLREGTLRL